MHDLVKKIPLLVNRGSLCLRSEIFTCVLQVLRYSILSPPASVRESYVGLDQKNGLSHFGLAFPRKV